MRRERPIAGHTRADSTGPGLDRWLKVDKAQAVWTSLKSIFGIRWVDHFGAEPSPEWREVLGRLEQKRLDYALNHLRDQPPPYSGWMPSLNEFQALARQLRIKAFAEPSAERKGTWVDHTCAWATIRWATLAAGIGNEYWHEMKPIFEKLAEQFNQIALGDPTLTKEEVRRAVEKKLQQWWESRESEPRRRAMREALSSSTPSGPLIQDALSISDSSSNPARIGSTPSSSTPSGGEIG